MGKNVRTSQNVDHIRATENLSIGPIVQYYCVTGNADEDVRVWVYLLSCSPLSSV